MRIVAQILLMTFVLSLCCGTLYMDHINLAQTHGQLTLFATPSAYSSRSHAAILTHMSKLAQTVVATGTCSAGR